MRAAHRQRGAAGVLGFAGNRLQQQRPAGDDFAMLIGIGQPDKQAPPVVDQRHAGGQQAATFQILGREAAPAPMVLQLIKRVLAIRSWPRVRISLSSDVTKAAYSQTSRLPPSTSAKPSSGCPGSVRSNSASGRLN